MKIALRNRLAEWMLEALSGEAGAARVRALARLARAADDSGAAPALGEADAARLADLLEPGAAPPRLRPELVGDLPALRERAARFERALDAPPPDAAAAPLDRLLTRAGALLDAELFFEVHELLEPAWREAEEPLRTFLQGLIQVAVGFHHREGGNDRGAVSLLRDGGGRLAVFRPRAFGVELDELCRSVSSIAAALAADPSSAAARRPAPRLRRAP